MALSQTSTACAKPTYTWSALIECILAAKLRRTLRRKLRRKAYHGPPTSGVLGSMTTSKRRAAAQPAAARSVPASRAPAGSQTACSSTGAAGCASPLDRSQGRSRSEACAGRCEAPFPGAPHCPAAASAAGGACMLQLAAALTRAEAGMSRAAASKAAAAWPHRRASTASHRPCPGPAAARAACLLPAVLSAPAPPGAASNEDLTDSAPGAAWKFKCAPAASARHPCQLPAPAAVSALAFTASARRAATSSADSASAPGAAALHAAAAIGSAAGDVNATLAASALTRARSLAVARTSRGGAYAPRGSRPAATRSPSAAANNASGPSPALCAMAASPSGSACRSGYTLSHHPLYFHALCLLRDMIYTAHPTCDLQHLHCLR